MSVHYLRFNIFELAIKDMAISRDKLSERLASAYINYIYKVDWKRDLELIPLGSRDSFLNLRKIFEHDLRELLAKKRAEDRALFTRFGSEVDEDKINNRVTMERVIQGLHWRKATQLAELIVSVHADLSRAEQFQTSKK